MLVAASLPLFSPPLHGGQFTWDEFLCTGLVAVCLVIGAFVVWRMEKENKREASAAPAEPPPEK